MEPTSVCVKSTPLKAAVDDKEMELTNDCGRLIVLHQPFTEMRAISLGTACDLRRDYVNED